MGFIKLECFTGGQAAAKSELGCETFVPTLLNPKVLSTDSERTRKTLEYIISVKQRMGRGANWLSNIYLRQELLLQPLLFKNRFQIHGVIKASFLPTASHFK